MCADLESHITSASQPSDLGLNEGKWVNSTPSSPPGSIRNYASSTSAGPSARSKARPSSITVLSTREFHASEGHLNSAPATAVPSPSGSRHPFRHNLEEKNIPSPGSGGHRRTRSMVSSPGSSRLTQGDVSICKMYLGPRELTLATPSFFPPNLICKTSTSGPPQKIRFHPSSMMFPPSNMHIMQCLSLFTTSRISCTLHISKTCGILNHRNNCTSVRTREYILLDCNEMVIIN